MLHNLKKKITINYLTIIYTCNAMGRIDKQAQIDKHWLKTFLYNLMKPYEELIKTFGDQKISFMSFIYLSFNLYSEKHYFNFNI